LLQIVGVARSNPTSDIDHLVHGQGFAHFHQRTLIHIAHLTSASLILIRGADSKIIVELLHNCHYISQGT
jgi:hypothetical protein